MSDLGEGSHPATRLNESGSNDRHLAGEHLVKRCALTKQTSLAIKGKQVAIDPEAEAHVWVEQQVDDSPTRYTSVFIDVALSVCNLNNATQRVYDHPLDAVRCTTGNVDEHVVIEKQVNTCDLEVAMTGQGLEPCAPRWMSAVP